MEGMNSNNHDFTAQQEQQQQESLLPSSSTDHVSQQPIHSQTESFPTIDEENQNWNMATTTTATTATTTTTITTPMNVSQEDEIPSMVHGIVDTTSMMDHSGQQQQHHHQQQQQRHHQRIGSGMSSIGMISSSHHHHHQDHHCNSERTAYFLDAENGASGNAILFHQDTSNNNNNNNDNNNNNNNDNNNNNNNNNNNHHATDSKNNNHYHSSLDNHIVNNNNQNNNNNNNHGLNEAVPLVGDGIAAATSSETDGLEVNIRFCVYIGKAAHRYGSSGSKVEVFLRRLLEERYGYHLGLFRSTQNELFCSVCRTEDDVPRTIMVSINDNNNVNLNKLSLLSDLVDSVFKGQMTQSQALVQLQVIETTPDPWGMGLFLLSFVFVGGGLTMLLGGSWWDVLVASILGTITFATITFMPRFGAKMAQWIPLTASLLCTAVATAVQSLWIHSLNVTLSTLTALAVLLPGYTVSMGIGEIVSNRIVSGMAGLVSGMVTMLWLVIGAVIGDAIVKSILDPNEESDTMLNNSTMIVVDDDDNASYYNENSVPMAWQALFFPLLCFSLIVAFQISRRDSGWTTLHLTLTYLVFYATGQWTHNVNLGTFLAAVVSTMAANGWAIYTNRPNTILLVPSLVMQVSGSIGFRGLISIFVNGNTTLGTEQFIQMLIVALLIVAGLLTGNTLVEPATTL